MLHEELQRVAVRSHVDNSANSQVQKADAFHQTGYSQVLGSQTVHPSCLFSLPVPVSMTFFS